MRLVIVKLLEENAEKKPSYTGLGNDSMTTAPKIQTAQAKINQKEHIKLKGKAKETNNKMKKQPVEQKKNICKL